MCERSSGVACVRTREGEVEGRRGGAVGSVELIEEGILSFKVLN